ncbi:MAG: SulP family inorganic anion transporter [Microscillaceae bacterium]
MQKKMILKSENPLAHLQYDFPAGLVVFLVAIPLCLGLALASNTSFFSGIIAGIVGGLVVPLISKSQLSVSGPAAGLTAIVVIGLERIGAFEGFLVAVFLAGIIQLGLGLIRSGFIAYYIPATVIKGMLAAIGVILILKQLPHAVGYDHELFGMAFQEAGDENTFTALIHALGHIEWGALVISAICIGILILWEKTRLKKMTWLPGALVVVVVGALLNTAFRGWSPSLYLQGEHLVNLPEVKTFQDFLGGFAFPDWTFLAKQEVWITAFTLGFVASIESLLTVEAVDKLDPYKRKTPLNRELFAQGTGNIVAGLIGGIPITSVIVRSSALMNAGGRTKSATMIHGVLLVLAVIFFWPYLNQVPLASLAAILLVVGYKLARPSLFFRVFRKGMAQFIPFVVTIIAILFTDLLIGVSIGIVVGLFYVIRTNFHAAILMVQDGHHYMIRLNKDVSFLNKPLLIKSLESIAPNSAVIVDGTKAQFVDNDILEVLDEFKVEAQHKNIKVEFRNISNYSPPAYKTPFAKSIPSKEAIA